MTRLVSTVKLETTMMVRQGFAAAAVISGLLWLTVLLPMPHDLRPIVEPYVLIGDITIIGFFFIGASVFYEKQEGTLHAVVCSPMRFWEYLLAKIVVLMAISLFVAMIVVTVVSGTDYRAIPVLAGVTLGTVVMLLTGFASSLPFTSVSDWFLATTIPLALLALPILHLSGVWPSPLLYLIPTQGPLLLFGTAFDQIALAPWQMVYALIYPLLCSAGLYVLARRLFVRHVIERAQ